MREMQNLPAVRPAYILVSQSTNPIPAGSVGFWYDGTTVYSIDASGNKTVLGSAGGNTYHEACRLATAAALASNVYDATALTLTASSNGALTVDGVLVKNGDRLLVKNESTDTNNGIYVVTNKGVTSTTKYVLTRAPDCNSSSQFEPAFITSVAEGSVNADTVFEFTANAPFTMDTSSATFSLMPISITYGAAGDMASDGTVAANSAGVSTKVARTDHQHAFATDLVAAKEVDHVIYPTASTTSATAGGAMTLRGAVSKTSGAGGTANVIGGAGDTSGAGGAAAVTGGSGGSTGGAGGAVTMTGGAAAAGGANGGAVTIRGGAKNGAGTAGVLTIGDTNTSAIAIGASTNVATFSCKTASAASANLIADPGNAGAIAVTADGVCALTSAGAETRTLAIPTYVGQHITLVCDTFVGNIVTTVASAFDSATHTTITMSAAGKTISLIGVTVGGTRAWRLLGNDGCTLG